ncbi:MAG: hypothetical protein JWO58_1173 [Chitinophagaceae bacterium]|nr:hypothetical protein [Chitinophagaceae bacterium]
MDKDKAALCMKTTALCLFLFLSNVYSRDVYNILRKILFTMPSG